MGAYLCFSIYFYRVIMYLLFMPVVFALLDKNFDNKIQSNKFKQTYTPDWKSLDTRPLPDWYDQAKFGIFIHWGLYSVPSFLGEWFWWNWKGQNDSNAAAFMSANYPPNWQYADFAPEFHAELFDPSAWALLIERSRARYVVLTAKHHEGFTMWPSSHSWQWNAFDVGPRRDIVGELATAIRARGIHFGLYHSLFEWFNPLFIEDVSHAYLTQHYVRAKVIPCLHELVERYRPEVLWSDGDGGWDWYWNSTEFLAWLYNDSPVRDTIVTNDRWGFFTLCQHGDFHTCGDRFTPGALPQHKWESCVSLDRAAWGYRRTLALADVLSTDEVVRTLVQVVALGGNLLLNVGPTADGRIVPVFEERLRQIGCWLDLNGDAIFGTHPWTYQNDTPAQNIWYTASSSGALYASVLDWQWDASLSVVFTRPLPTAASSSARVRSLEGGDGKEELDVADATAVRLLGWSDTALEWTPLPPPATRGLRVTLPAEALKRVALARAPFECAFGALVFQMTNVT